MRKPLRHLALASFGALLLTTSGCTVPAPVDPSQASPMACAQETKVCADGTIVSRTGPQCEFPDCPDAANASPDNGLTPDPAPEGPDGDTNPKPMGTFTDPEPPPG